MAKVTSVRKSEARSDLHTLAIDVGGTGIKVSVLDGTGRMLVERVRIDTPYPCRPQILLRAIAELAKTMPAFDRISIGFPGVVRRGRVITAPHFGTEWWHDYPLEEALSHQFSLPTRLLNDAEVQGLGVITGRNLEVVLTLGTGVGTAVFNDGRLAPHLELAQHPIHKSKTYNEYIGNEALHSCKVKKWSHRVRKTIDIVHTLLNYDLLYIGGGNAAKIEADLPSNVRICSNDAGITGGIHLWDEPTMPVNGDGHHPQ
jgi:polyphosphate glucokinase